MVKNLAIETARLQLSSPTSSDSVVLRELWRNEQVRQYLGGSMSDINIDQKIVAIQEHWNKHHFGQCTVKLKTTDQIIGICGLHHSEDGIEISYMFFPEFWGQGLASEAVHANLDIGFKVLNLQKIIAITQQANQASCRLLERVGMRRINTLLRYGEHQCLYECSRAGLSDPP
jgi:[ribosomal protein S5]-alanine N-acetyltransferase